MVDVEESRFAGAQLDSLLEKQVRGAMEMASAEAYQAPDETTIARARHLLGRIQQLGPEMAESTFVSIGVDGRFGFVTLLEGFRVSYELPNGPTGFGVVVRNLETGHRLIREDLSEDEMMSEIAGARRR